MEVILDHRKKSKAGRFLGKMKSGPLIRILSEKALSVMCCFSARSQISCSPCYTSFPVSEGMQY